MKELPPKETVDKPTERESRGNQEALSNNLLNPVESKSLNQRQTTQARQDDQNYLRAGLYAPLEISLPNGSSLSLSNDTNFNPAATRTLAPPEQPAPGNAPSALEAGVYRSTNPGRTIQDSQIPPESRLNGTDVGTAPATTTGDAADGALKGKVTPVDNSLAMENFSSTASNVLHRIDADGAVTKEQLAKALQDPSFTGQDAQALAAMYRNFDQLNSQSASGNWNQPAVLSREDLTDFENRRQRVDAQERESKELQPWARRNLENFDSDNDGNLSAKELQEARVNQDNSEEDKRFLAIVERDFNSMKPFWESGVSLENISDYRQRQSREPEAKLSDSIASVISDVNEQQGDKTVRQLYGAGGPEASIVPDAVQQGSIGNCYFAASLSAAAASNPELIRNAIVDNGNGTYTVTFPGAEDRPVTVSAPTQAEQGLYAQASPHGTWAAVMEKAYGEYLRNNPGARSYSNPFGGLTPQEGSDKGGLAAGPMQLLTGSPVDFKVNGFRSQQEVATDLTAAFSSNPPKVVTASIFNLHPSGETEDGFTAGHAYAVTGFKADGKGGGTVTVRNPWGQGEGTPDGTITMSLDKFMRNFQRGALFTQR